MAGEKARTVSLVILASIAVVAVLYFLKPLLIPFLIAVMLTYILSPLVERLAGYKIPRLLSILVLFLIVFGVLGVVLELLISNALAFADKLPEYRVLFQELLADYSSRYAWLDSMLENLTGFIFGLPIGSFTNSVVNSSVSFLSNSFLVLLFVIYLLISAHGYPDKIRKAYPGSKGEKILKVWSHINKDVRKYLDIHSLISLATGVTVGIICWALGIPFAFLWGFLAFILNYIPTIGSIVAAIPPIITAAVVLGMMPAIWAAVLIILAQLVWGNVVETRIAGESLGISPLAILLSLVFMGWLWGVVGAILAVPIASMVKIVCANIDSLKPISELMKEK